MLHVCWRGMLHGHGTWGYGLQLVGEQHFWLKAIVTVASVTLIMDVLIDGRAETTKIREWCRP